MTTFRTPGGRTLSVADFAMPPYLPVIVPVNVAVTGTVVMRNVPEVAPAGTVMNAGQVAFVFVLVSATTAPSVGAGPLSVTLPVTFSPPATDAGVSVSPVG